MQERRRSPRQTKCLRGRIYFNSGRQSVSCLIRDIAYEGARIIITKAAAIPNEIDLYIPKRKRITHASVRWRHGDSLGLALSEIGRHAEDRPARMRHISCAGLVGSPR
jgi:PilZ domain